MQRGPILETLPALEALPAQRRPPAPRRRSGPLVRLLSFVGGWAWRWLVGAVFCMNYLTAMLVVGWLYRWVQSAVLRDWWLRSRHRDEQSFEDFCASLGPDAPSPRPRWFLRDTWDREEIRAEVRRPTHDGEPPGALRRGVRWLLSPFRSLGLNLAVGIQGVVATFLLSGWGCALMTFSWYFGWLNSFHKGYELAFVGPLTGVAGIALFVAAMLYVPMAQVHQAVTGDFRAFFEFRFVWRLIRARLGGYVILAGFLLLFGTAVEILKTLPGGFDDHVDYFTNLTDRQLLQFFQLYYFGCALFLCFTLLATRAVATRIYASAVLRVLRLGRVRREQVHPRLADWLGRLDIFPPVRPPARGVGRVVRRGVRRLYRAALFPLLAALWFGFVAKTYVGEFGKFHPVIGYLNHPLIQLPCVNYIPQQLQDDAKREPVLPPPLVGDGAGG